MNVRQLFDLGGKVAIVTGAVKGLGLEMAEALAEAGCSVIVTSRDLASAEEASAKLQAATGSEAKGLPLDQRRHEDVKRMFAEALEWKGRIDILINNAGGGSGARPGHLLQRDPADVAALLEVNLTGVLHCCQEVARVMIPKNSGKIINLGSVAGLVGRDRRLYEHNGMRGQPIDYAAAKAGVIGMTRDLAGLLSPHGICVNCISPGGFARDNLPAGFIREYSDRTPLGRMGREGMDLKGAALFLASAASDYVTGHNLVVDGGFSLWR